MKKNRSNRKNVLYAASYNEKNVACRVDANTPDFMLSNVVSTYIR